MTKTLLVVSGMALVLALGGCFGGDDDSGGDKICTPQEKKCDEEGAVEECNSDGTGWDLVQVCLEGCNLGECVAGPPDETCIPSETRCDAVGDVEECNVMGTGWDVVEICLEGCNLGECVWTEIPPGNVIWACGCDMTCDGETMELEPEYYCMPDGDVDETAQSFADGCFQGLLEAGCSEDDSGCLCACAKTEEVCEE